MEGLTAYEIERQERIANNRRRMEEMGLLKQVKILEAYKVVKKPAADKPARQPKFKPTEAVELVKRRSKRVAGQRPDYSELLVDEKSAYTENGALIDLMDRGAKRARTDPDQPLTQEQLEDLNERRCNSKGRGSTYDSALGITCHFCRQKKLCGEAHCPRCANRDASKECIGKTACTRCGLATGRFCRACLDIRYGQTMEEVQAEMAAGTWLCPHCYEEEHPHAGIICNSSICMRRRGLQPTGIAIYECQQQGYRSVAHYLQAQLVNRSDICIQPVSAKACTTQANSEISPSAAGPSQVPEPSGMADAQDTSNGAVPYSAIPAAVDSGLLNLSERPQSDDGNQEDGATLAARCRTRTAAAAAVAATSTNKAGTQGDALGASSPRRRHPVGATQNNSNAGINCHGATGQDLRRCPRFNVPL